MGQAKTPSIPEKRPVRAQIKVLTRADKQISVVKFAYQWPADLIPSAYSFTLYNERCLSEIKDVFSGK